MFRLIAIIILIANPVFTGCVQAKQFTDLAIAGLQEQAKQKQLYRHSIWIKLLNYLDEPGGRYESTIISPDYFIADNGNINPEAELEATLTAFFDPVGTDVNTHPQCLFPARMQWLQTMLDFNSHQLPDVKCDKLEAWADFENLESVSLIMVSGYFGNPASTFGHNLIKLNNSKSSDSGNLLDLGINYGAAVPENEPTFIYIMKGLFGGYVGGFSDRTFYTQDTLYSETQFRDMWEYELALTEYQKRFLVFHLWELVGKKQVYFFLKENCGYRVAELLELVTGEDIIRNWQPWFLPIDVFHGLDGINEKNKSSLIKNVRYIPSGQRLLYRDFDKLASGESRVVNSAIASESIFSPSSIFDEFSAPEQARMADVLLSYYQYKLAALEDDTPDTLNKNKDAVLKYRLALPVYEKDQDIIKPQLPPASGSRPSLTRTGFGYNEDQGLFTQFGFAAVNYDVLGIQRSSLEHSELKVANIQFGVNKSSNFYIDYFDLVSIQKISTKQTGLHDESNRSWRVSAGLQRRDLSCIDCQVIYLEGGPGRAFRISEFLISYGMLDLNIQSKTEHISVTPSVGLIFKGKAPFKMVAEIGSRLNRHNGNGDTVIKFESRYALSVKNQIRFGFDHYRGTEYRLGFFHYW